MSRVLLLLPTTTYRAPAFLEAARRVGADVVVASERPNPLQALQPDSLLTLNFADAAQCVRRVLEFSARRPIDAVVGVDDTTTVLAATLSQALSRPHNTVASAAAARDKFQMRALLSRDAVPVPSWGLRSLDDNLAAEAQRTVFPCVVKPLALSASRGVIRADDAPGFVGAVRRLESILRTPDAAADGDAARHFLVEQFVPGREVALEGLLIKGELQVLALFDKPDPLDGPFFEETIYVAPSRLPASAQAEVTACSQRAARALGLLEGPVHAELRINRFGPSVIEVAARSIGGLCARTLRFGAGLALEEVILRHALGVAIPSLEREPRATGVMMIPIPGAGVLRAVRGLDAAQRVPGIVEVTLCAHPGQELVPLPEAASYLGFIFARGESPEGVEAALRRAHRQLEFVLMPRKSTVTATPTASPTD